MGLIQPIEVDENGVIITGESRYFAARAAGLKEVECRVISGMERDERFMRQMVENIQRRDLSPVEIARGLEKMRSRAGASISEPKLGGMIGKSADWVSRHLAIVGLSENSLAIVEKHGSSIARVLSGINKTERENSSLKGLTKQVVEKIKSGKMPHSHQSVQKISTFIRLNPKLKDDVLGANYMNTDGSLKSDGQVEGLLEGLAEEKGFGTKRIERETDDMLKLVEKIDWFFSNPKNHYSKLHPSHKIRVSTILMGLRSVIVQWMKT